MSQSERPHHSLSTALRTLAEDEAALGASAEVETRLIAEVRAIAARRTGRRRGVLFLAAAASVVATLASWQLIARQRPIDAGAVSREVATEVLPLTYGAVPLTGGHIVRLDVPRSALTAFGLGSIDLPTGSADTVEADVLVGADGLARAVRFVHQIKSEE